MPNSQFSKTMMIAVLDEVRKMVAKEVAYSIKIDDFTNARKYTTTSKHLAIAANLMGKKNG